MMRVSVMRMLLSILAIVVSASGGLAQTYPSRAITIVVPFAAGGATDVVARLIGERLSAKLGQPVLIENKSGANGAIGSALVAKANPDGYMLVMGGVNTHAMNDSIVKPPLYSSTKDFAPIGLIAEIPIAIVVHPSLGVSTLPEMIKLVKEKPNTISYGSSGTGGPHHLAMEMFKSIAKLDMPHVPYRGGAPQLNDLLAGHIKIGVVGLPPVLPHLNAGTLRALAVVEGQRSELLPNVPTIAEQGFPGFAVNYWMGLLAPAKTPNDVIARLSKELTLILDEPDVAPALRKQGATILRGTPEEFSKLIASEVPRWAAVVNNIGATLDSK
ncbi:MAG: tripartite tricarboxylate transporter substrate binding protein [Pseudolabrys sp.]|nr:tripartite tricarboxylate transporter substrate binding protein [Pseudolabrys sp.]